VQCRPRTAAEDERELGSGARKSQIFAKLGVTQIKVRTPVCADLRATNLRCDKTAHSDKAEGPARRLPAWLFTRRIVLGECPHSGRGAHALVGMVIREAQPQMTGARHVRLPMTLGKVAKAPARELHHFWNNRNVICTASAPAHHGA